MGRGARNLRGTAGQDSHNRFAAARVLTGRDQMRAPTGLWAQQFGTPNWDAHGGLCSVNMAAAGLYSIGTALRALALVAGFGVALLLLAFGDLDWRAGAAAFVRCMLGMMAERWLFFAEARHTVWLYRGEAAP